MTVDKQRRFSNWQQEYQSKMVSAEEAAKVVKSGDRVALPCVFLGVTPIMIMARRDELKDVEIQAMAPAFDPGWYAGDVGDCFKLVVDKYLYTVARPAHDAKKIDFLPCTNGNWWKPFRDEREDRRNIDVFITQVSPPDENGFCSFGHELWERKNYARAARTIIGEVSQHAIRTHGENSIHVSDIDYFVDVTMPLPAQEEIDMVINAFPSEKQSRTREMAPGFHPVIVKVLAPVLEQRSVEEMERILGIDEPDEAARAIAENLKTVIKDRDTVQIGIGRPSRYMVDLGVFDSFKDLSIYSEMACPGMAWLVKKGIVNGKYATLHPGQAVFTGFQGLRWDEIQFAHNNPMFALYGSDYVLDITNIAANDNLVAINNGLQVDLVGQITCETQFGFRMINGPGGQIEFHIGAFLSKGGRAVTLLPSTALGGSVSTIVSQLDQGSIVDIPRSYADIIITEYGIASLSSKTHRERAQALIAIAHPDYRDELQESARALFGL